MEGPLWRGEIVVEAGAEGGPWRVVRPELYTARTLACVPPNEACPAHVWVWSSVLGAE